MKYIIIIGLIIYCFNKFFNADNSFKPHIDKIKGNIGEDRINIILSKLSDCYNVKYDVRVGKAQIDHMVIKGKTIFVIETKKWCGRIVGNKDDEHWKQVINGKSYTCGNPIKQNQFHIHELKKMYPDYKMINVVVFIDNKSVPRLKNVIKENELYNFIVNYA